MSKVWLGDSIAESMPARASPVCLDHVSHVDKLGTVCAKCAFRRELISRLQPAYEWRMGRAYTCGSGL